MGTARPKRTIRLHPHPQFVTCPQVGNSPALESHPPCKYQRVNDCPPCGPSETASASARSFPWSQLRSIPQRAGCLHIDAQPNEVRSVYHCQWTKRDRREPHSLQTFPLLL